MRKPRTFTWSSTRPRNSNCPPQDHRTTSPVRYIRAPGPPNGSATNRPAVSPARPQYPRATPAPATYNSPPTPGATGRRHPSSTYSRAFATGRPIGTAPPGTTSPGPTTNTEQPTVASVGPYSFTTDTPGRSRRRTATAPPGSCSPPTTTCSVADNPTGNSASNPTCAGVTFENDASNPSGNHPASSSPVNHTHPPNVNGTNTPVTVRSKAIDVCTTDRPASPGYARPANHTYDARFP